MELSQFFKSVLEQDTAPVVICDLTHIIVYMNPAAIRRYKNDLTGKPILDCHNDKANEMIKRVVEWFAADRSHNKVYTFRNDKENKDVYMIALRNDSGELIGYYEKHEYRDAENMKKYELY